MSFTGNPGTGKTTVALRMASILHRLGYIDKGHLVSVTRDDLVGQYVGHTAPKTKDVVKRALGGVLFIDEAYYLHRQENERDYGQEAVEVLLQVMESERQDLVVVMAGYRDRMEEFFQANPGMGSRVAHHIHFPDYDIDELLDIARLMVERQGYEMSDDAVGALRAYIERRVERPRFAHGRSIRNAVERARMRQATRLFDAHRKLTRRDLVTIEPEDILGSSVFADSEGRARGLTGTMARPIILGVVGDSAAGKTTMTRGLVRILGEQQVTAVSTDDYHRYDRKQRAEHGITPLHPDCNYVDIMSQHLGHLRAGEPILKPVYVHSDGTFGPPVYVNPKPFTIVEGLLGYHSEALLDVYDVRVYLAPPEDLRRRWKVKRDTSRRGYTTDQVLRELDRREPDSAQFIRPQERYADLVVSFREGEDRDPHALDAELLLRDTLPHPDLSPVSDSGERGVTWRTANPNCWSGSPVTSSSSRPAEIEEAIWEKLHFASHLRSERLGQFVVGNDLQRSASLALVQLLILYHLVTAKAAIALGGLGPRAEAEDAVERETAETVRRGES